MRRFGRILAAVLLMAAGMSSAAERDYSLVLGEQRFDPLRESPTLPLGLDRSAVEGPDLHLIQLEGPAKQAELDKLRAGGAKIVQFIAPHSYVVWCDREQRVRAAAEPFVRWAGDFAPAYRLLPRYRAAAGRSVETSVMIYRGADVKGTIGKIVSIGGVNTSRATVGKFEIARFTLPGERLADVARIPGVYSVKERPSDGGLRGEMTNQLNVGNYDGTNAAFPGYQAWLTSIGLDGSGVVIANVDSGVDDAHPDLASRMLPCTGTTCGGGTSSGHGTHTAGTMAATGASGTLDGFGFLRGLGVAPGATLVEQLYNPTFTQAGGMQTLMRESAENGADLSGNSWGPAGTPQGYDDDTLQVDLSVRDALPAVPGNQEFTYVLSFMNGNGGTSSQGSPDEAKNLFNIGSTKAQVGGGAQDLDIDSLSANSAHGPALDGRTIPHMVAPGCQVDSTEPGGGYGLRCGTSMASPHVSGGVALFFELWRNRPEYVADPSPALVKAAFLSAATNLSGNDDADGVTLGIPFDSKQGWGRMDLAAVVDPPAEGVRYWDQELLFDGSGEFWETNVAPLDPAEPMRIMLVWTDAPGHGLGGATPAWNNNLDLELDANGTTYLGNVFGTDGLSVDGGSADAINNTEGIFVVAAGGGTLRVRATEVGSDGVPNVGDDTDQDFAVVCRNCAVEPTFTLGVDAASKAVCAPAEVSWPIEIGQIIGFSEDVTLSVTGNPGSASFDTNPVTPPATSQLTLTGLAAGGVYDFSLDGDSATRSRSLALSLRVDDGVPAAPALDAPADAATDVSIVPQLNWIGNAESTGYTLEVATDAAFGDVVYTRTVGETSHDLEVGLEPDSVYYWRVAGGNGCGLGANGAPRSFTTRAVPPILVVDDDDNGPDVQATYTDALTALGLDYDVWDTGNSDDEPSAGQLAPYSVVIWESGDEFGGACGPGVDGEAALSSWLDDGGCLLIASQDYHYDRNLTSLMQDYLGVTSVANDQSQTSATGQGVFGGTGPFTLSLPYTNYTDTIVPDASAQIAFDGSSGTIAVTKDGGNHRTSFWAFGLEGIPVAEDREALLSTFVQWCNAGGGNDSDSDGYDDGEDCAPADANAWQLPGATSALTLDVAGDVVWAAPILPGANAVSYDLLRAASASDFSAATCLESDEADLIAFDAANPASGELWLYLVRSRNVCGGTLGTDSAGTERTGVACP